MALSVFNLVGTLKALEQEKRSFITNRPDLLFFTYLCTLLRVRFVYDAP